MSLIVKVTPDGAFAMQVQTALMEMCGCQSVVVDPITGQVTIGVMSCTCYCDHRAGCNLLTDLVNDARTIPIYLSEVGSGWKNGAVWWYPREEDFNDPDVCGGTKIPASILLAHELVHARLDSNNEDDAVRGENQIRLERCMPMRMEYGHVVPDFRVGILDASNRPEYGCNCRFWRGGFLATARRVWCALHSMYCFPSAFFGFRPTRFWKDPNG